MTNEQINIAFADQIQALLNGKYTPQANQSRSDDACKLGYRKMIDEYAGRRTEAQVYERAWRDALARKAMAEEENCNEPTSLNFSMEIRLERHDEIPAFGAFLRCEEQHDKSPVIYLNVQTCMIPELESETGTIISMSRDDRKRLIIESLMHEFGHALESHFRIPVNEDAIESACIAWEIAYALGREGGVSEI